MKSTKRKVILYIASSLYGYIAKPNDDLNFLSIIQKEGEDYGYTDFVKTIDTVPYSIYFLNQPQTSYLC